MKLNARIVRGADAQIDATPTPILTRVKLKDVRNHLPKDTPTVTPEARADELSRRVRAAQRRRRRW